MSVTEFGSQHLYCNLDASIFLYISSNPEPILMVLDSLESSRCDDSNEWQHKRKSLILWYEISRNLSISVTNRMLALVSEWYSQHQCYNLAVSISISELESQYLYYNLDVSISVTEFVSQHLCCNLDINILLYISANPEPISMG